MKKNILVEENVYKKSLIEKFGFLILSLVLVAMIYGGLSLNKLQKQNQVLGVKQAQLENKIASLETSNTDNQNKISSLSDDLQKNSDQISYYKTLTSNLQKENDQNKLALADIKSTSSTASLPSTPVDQAISPAALKPVIKTVTKKVYVKEPSATVYIKDTPVSAATVSIQNVGSYKVDLKTGDTAFSILQRAANDNGFKLDVTDFGDMGYMVNSIDGILPVGNQYWAFYYNGKYSDVGASGQLVSTGDTIFWELASF